MAEAYMCDNCEQYFKGDAFVTMGRSIDFLDQRTEWWLCSWECVNKLTQKIMVLQRSKSNG